MDQPFDPSEENQPHQRINPDTVPSENGTQWPGSDNVGKLRHEHEPKNVLLETQTPQNTQREEQDTTELHMGEPVQSNESDLGGEIPLDLLPDELVDTFESVQTR